MPRLFLLLFVAAALAIPAGPGVAQTRVKTETIRPRAPVPPPATAPIPPDTSDLPGEPEITGTVAAVRPVVTVTPPSPPQPKPDDEPDIVTDLSTLPAPVAQTRARILAAARSGRVEKLIELMRSHQPMPIFSLTSDPDPAATWSATFRDSGGLEILSTLIELLETGFVHVDRGTPQELYLWPYFARLPLDRLTPEQKVDLFRIVTGSDYKDMRNFGAYNFYRIGIGPDGTWHFFVSGD